MSARYEVKRDSKHVGYIRLGLKTIGVGPHKEVLRDSGSIVSGDRHTCSLTNNPRRGDQLHLKNFGMENGVELKGFATFEPGTKRFFHKEPASNDEPLEVIAQDDWEALDAGGGPGLEDD